MQETCVGQTIKPNRDNEVVWKGADETIDGPSHKQINVIPHKITNSPAPNCDGNVDYI